MVLRLAIFLYSPWDQRRLGSSFFRVGEILSLTEVSYLATESPAKTSKKKEEKRQKCFYLEENHKYLDAGTEIHVQCPSFRYTP